MNALVSIVVPLETLSGWPAAPDPSVLQVLGLLVGLPILAFIVVFGVAKLGTAAQAGRADQQPGESVAVRGGAPAGEVESGTGTSETGGAGGHH